MAIVAQYPGSCGACGRRYDPGTAIQRDGPRGPWMHVECPEGPGEDPTALRPGEAVCTECFLVHPPGHCRE